MIDMKLRDASFRSRPVVQWPASLDLVRIPSEACMTLDGEVKAHPKLEEDGHYWYYLHV